MTMDVIDEELNDIKHHCEDVIKGSKVISSVRAMVRVDIICTEHKQITVCIQFPEKYPMQPLLIELKSKYLSERLLDRLTKICDEECKKYIEKPQILKILKFIRNFIDDNPLCVCSEEITNIKKELIDKQDELKLKQKNSSISLRVFQDLYFLAIKITIPENYPLKQIELEYKDCNFPAIFKKYLMAQAKEISRQCVQPPLKKDSKSPPFEPKPSLWPVVSFLISRVKYYPLENCQLCKKRCFPHDPKDIMTEVTNDLHIERVYCDHLFHNGCLNRFMKTPPFQGGKKCPGCKQRIYHEKWKVTPQLAEARWAHHEAKKRELGEVVEFFN
ncbi:uncharacterized protein [Centruroides vittatus]|uniref:uncharacterized protein isoform X1 n=1 Tax=Centruroides vittatus TaxID=120091 RepID=UPI00350EAE84